MKGSNKKKTAALPETGRAKALRRKNLPAAKKAGEKKSQTTKSRRPGGRTERNRKLVANAVLKLILEGKLDFEIQDVVALSGIHRSTIFRRWPDRSALMAEALTEHVSRFSLDLTRNWQVDLRRFTHRLRDFFADPVELAMNRTLAITDNEMFQTQQFELWLPIIKSIAEILQSAQRRGEIDRDADTEIVVHIVMSTMLSLSIFGKGANDYYFSESKELIDRIINQLIRSCLKKKD